MLFKKFHHLIIVAVPADKKSKRVIKSRTAKFNHYCKRNLCLSKIKFNCYFAFAFQSCKNYIHQARKKYLTIINNKPSLNIPGLTIHILLQAIHLILLSSHLFL